MDDQLPSNQRLTSPSYQQLRRRRMTSEQLAYEINTNIARTRRRCIKQNENEQAMLRCAQVQIWLHRHLLKGHYQISQIV